MKVKMLTQTFWNGVRRIDDEVTVDSETGQRWIDKGIASFVESTPIAKTSEEEEVDGIYAGKKAKELYDLCVERGIPAEAKKAITYYVDLLEAADAELKTDSESNEQKEEV